MTQLIGPARVIDIRPQCAQDRNYRLAVEDILHHEARYGPIDAGAIVLVRTGFSRYYPDARLYLGSDVHGAVEGLSFPGFGEEAARALVARQVDLVGLDTAGAAVDHLARRPLDHGPSTTFPAHRVFGEANIPGLENVANLDQLPPVGATLVALPMKIDGGTGGPCRIIAILPRQR